MQHPSIIYLIAGLCVATLTVSGQSAPNPYEQLERAAAAFSTDPTNVRVLADAVFSLSHFDDASIQQLPRPVAALLENRFVAAERAYRAGQNPGVSEQNIAEALNSFASALALPEFAQTTQRQIRTLRMRMLTKSPRFLGMGMIHKDSSGSAAPISEVMSPVQALLVAQTMIDQKFVNPGYQLTPGEWEARESAGTREVNGIYHRGNTPTIAEIQDRFHEGLASISDADALAVLWQALSKMGIL